ncbi:MAG: PhoU family transcriptional regulator [Thermoplasmata archaeon]|nr:MAG: PhoU family transcriptional regulator [Thermoplasmata archaeon]
MILEMKNKSELMLDLAYSALLYNNVEIAQEVMALENEVDELLQMVQKEAISLAIEDKNVERTLVITRLATSIENVADAAVEIADVVIRGVELPEVFQMSVMDSDIVFETFAVQKGSMLDGKTLGEIELASNTGMWVIAIKRADHWIYGPDENTKILAGDVLFARGPAEGEEKLRRLCAALYSK